MTVMEEFSVFVEKARISTKLIFNIVSDRILATGCHPKHE